MITPVQCLEARKLLGWSRYRLASRCDRSYEFIRAFECKLKEVSPAGLAAIQHALEQAGVEFTNGSEPGVKLRKQE